MTKDEILKVVFALIDDYKPNGEQNHDTISNDNLQKLVAVATIITCRIDDVLTDTEKSKLKSIKDAHKLCKNYFDFLGVKD